MGNVSRGRQEGSRAAASNTIQRETCLILGGNGFVGSHIVDKLAARGDLHIRVMDRFDAGQQFHQSPNVATLKGSAFDPKDLKAALKGVSYVVHTLSATNPFTADIDPYADIENLRHSVEIFEACATAGIKKVAFISSGGAVYGSLAEQRVATEQDIPLPVSPYGICKLATEHYLEYAKRKYGLEYIVYRLSNPYGPRQVFKQGQGVIPAFLHHIINDEEITIYGDGKNSRDYIYIEDAAQMIADSLTKPNKHGVYNLGSGKQTAVNDIVAALERVLGKAVPVSYHEAPKTALQKTDISIDRFKEEFGEPLLTLFHDGLAKTISHIKQQVEA
jgi:UDP-glucose 4-epimerase